MKSETINGALQVIFPLIAERIKSAHDTAAAAALCANSGNLNGAFRILLDIEQPIFEANNLLNAASAIKRERED
jgi:hypothetical protein